MARRLMARFSGWLLARLCGRFCAAGFVSGMVIFFRWLGFARLCGRFCAAGFVSGMVIFFR